MSRACQTLSVRGGCFVSEHSAEPGPILHFWDCRFHMQHTLTHTLTLSHTLTHSHTHTLPLSRSLYLPSLYRIVHRARAPPASKARQMACRHVMGNLCNL
ncbi:hypothetical protein AOQ84DRAFT_218521 [Glonium stellatum]|uniref:Uncharacterized protein n=1 Tax=Glonium stellatum TaxID=574774 RepID=A0A8E2F4F6_9PEZI|nr:hypothetical protein AOQ84DRAFT_218521 [Glonium stellatum]